MLFCTTVFQSSGVFMVAHDEAGIREVTEVRTRAVNVVRRTALCLSRIRFDPSSLMVCCIVKSNESQTPFIAAAAYSGLPRMMVCLVSLCPIVGGF